MAHDPQRINAAAVLDALGSVSPRRAERRLPGEDASRRRLVEAAATTDADGEVAPAYMALAFTQATMPHRRTDATEFVRANGAYTLTMLAPSKIGLPFGTIPRILLAWLTTEAVLKRRREIPLGHSLAEFMRRIRMMPTGGQRGNITYLRDQMRRLFACSVSCTYTGVSRDTLKHVYVADEADLWWSPHEPERAADWQSVVVLGERFYSAAIASPVPVCLDALRALRRSPLALDIYCWLTHRMSYLRRATVISWPALQMQFGADYARDAHGVRDFRRAFKRELQKVLSIYSRAKVSADQSGLCLHRSPPHVTRREPMRLAGG